MTEPELDDREAVYLARRVRRRLLIDTLRNPRTLRERLMLAVAMAPPVMRRKAAKRSGRGPLGL